MAPIEPPHPKLTLQNVDGILHDLQTFLAADPENDTLNAAEDAASTLRRLLASYVDSYVSKDT